jgi:hypothetical protein
MTATSIVPSSSLNVCEAALQNGQAWTACDGDSWNTTAKTTIAIEKILRRRISVLRIGKATADLLNYTASKQKIGSVSDYIIGHWPRLLNRVGWRPYFARPTVPVKMQNFSI